MIRYRGSIRRSREETNTLSALNDLLLSVTKFFTVVAVRPVMRR